jgi:hypothetical protein
MLESQEWITIEPPLALALAMQFSTQCQVGSEHKHITVDYQDALGIMKLAQAYLLHGRSALGAKFDPADPAAKEPPCPA